MSEQNKYIVPTLETAQASSLQERKRLNWGVESQEWRVAITQTAGADRGPAADEKGNQRAPHGQGKNPAGSRESSDELNRPQVTREYDETPLILVVDDDPAICDLLGEFLESLGFLVVTASTGADALAQARTVKPTLVISDISMPEMDGTELARALHERPETQDVRLVLMSAWQGQLRSSERRGTADAYLAKPFDLDAVENLVIGLLDRPRWPPI